MVNIEKFMPSWNRLLNGSMLFKSSSRGKKMAARGGR
jgi:hypothetical protein